MVVNRPGILTAAAVMAIVYGSVGSLCGLCGAASLMTQGAQQKIFAGNDPAQLQIQQQVQAAIESNIPGYRIVSIVGTLVGLAQS